jgi:hypothetical protein
MCAGIVLGAITAGIPGARLLWAQGSGPEKARAAASDTQRAEKSEHPELPAIHGVAGGRAMVPKDLFGIRKYGTESVSPDGQMIAVEVNRWAPGARRASGQARDEYGMELNHRIDLWVIDRNTGSRRCLTPREPIELSQWAPMWSPDSKKLAFFSTEGKETAFLEVWDRAKGQVRRMTTVGVDTDAEIDQNVAQIYHQVLWLDNENLLVVLLPPGLHAHKFDEYSRSLALAEAGFHAAVCLQQSWRPAHRTRTECPLCQRPDLESSIRLRVHPGQLPRFPLGSRAWRSGS